MINQEWNARLDALAARVVGEFNAAPACMLGLAVRKGNAWQTSVGTAGTLDVPGLGSVPLSPACFFDLASLTKPVTALVAARIIACSNTGLLWSTVLGDCLPELRDTAASKRTLTDLLSHRAGLQAHVNLWGLDRDALLKQAAEAVRPEANAANALYGDLGPLLVGAALERITGQGLDALVDEHIAKPLQIDMLSAGQLRARIPAGELALREHIASTEALEHRSGSAIRTICGEVHDDNAWTFAQLGSCGHAGLFASVGDVLGLAMALVDTWIGRRQDWLAQETLRWLTAPREDSCLRVGFDSPNVPAVGTAPSSAGRFFARESFGHLGFTGTSLWIDPIAECAIVMLTNRVNPSRNNDNIRRARPVVHDAIRSQLTPTLATA